MHDEKRHRAKKQTHSFVRLGQRCGVIDHRLGRADGGPERCTGATPVHRRPQHSPLAAIRVSFVSVFVCVFVVCVCVCVVVVGVFLKQRGVSLRGLREHGTLF
jgi:hypothetical protein